MKAPRCIICQTEFTPVRFLQRVCSIPCSKVWAKQKESEAKERNIVKRPSKPSKDANTYLNARKAFLRDVRERYGCVTCERCGRDGRYATIEVHHIVYRSEKPRHEHLHSFENLMCLCLTCHEWIHESKGNRDQIVAERKLNLLFGDSVLNKMKS